MKVIEIELKVYLKKDILLENARNEICSLLDYSFSENEEFLNFHKENKFKYYVFSLFYPIEKDKVYKEGKYIQF